MSESSEQRALKYIFFPVGKESDFDRDLEHPDFQLIGNILKVQDPLAVFLGSRDDSGGVFPDCPQDRPDVTLGVVVVVFEAEMPHDLMLIAEEHP